MSVKLAIPQGKINLAGKDGSLFKRTLLCREGVWDGAYGQCHVTPQMLEMLADRYNKQRANPLNENDYAPILKNHNRDVDGVLGRIVTPLTVEDFADPETGVVGQGLFGPVRVDDPIAKANVESGKYAQGSLNFDETGLTEIFEWSFVAVEAARRSQVLEQGDTRMSVELQKQLDAANQKHQALAKKLASQKLTRKESMLAMGTVLSMSLTSISSFESTVKDVSLQMRQVALTSQLRSYVREGKMTKAEFDGVKVKELAALEPVAAKMVLAAYENRKPSSDIIQHGQIGAKQVNLSNVPPSEMRLMMEAQRTGKAYTPTALAAGDEESDEEKAKKVAAAAAGGKKDGEGEGDSETQFSDIEDTLKKLNECMPAVAKLREHMKSMDEAIGKMRGSDEEDDAA